MCARARAHTHARTHTHTHTHTHTQDKNTAIMIWLGILIDAIPESMVIGFIVSEGSRNPLVFVVGVFLSNFPEALASAATMKKVLCVRARVRVQAYMCVHTHIHTYTTYSMRA